MLEAYKDGKLTSENASKQLKELSDIIHTESKNIEDKDFHEGHRLFMIYSEAWNASFELEHKKVYPIYKINESISTIKEYM